MTCTSCGHTNPERARFREMGAPLQVERLARELGS